MSDKEFDRPALTSGAVAASVSVASTYGIRASDPQVLADAYSVRVHLKPAPIVARISTLTSILRSPIESWLARELSVAKFLAAKSAPVVPPSDLLPAIPHHCDGLAMTFWRYFEPISDAVPARAILGRMQAELHAVLRDYPGDLPPLPALNDIPRGIDRLQQLGNILPASDLTLLQTTYDRLLPQLTDPAGLLQPLHGDAHALNLIPTAKGLLWNDFEDTCTGSSAWDLINLKDEGIAAYPNAPDLAILQPYRFMRKLHAIVWVYAMLPELPDWLESAKALLDDLRNAEAVSDDRLNPTDSNIY